jgi:hypothetical protein
MARSQTVAQILAAAVAASLCGAEPAAAQFGDPPRPPSDVPARPGRPPPPPAYPQQQQPQGYPQQGYPQQGYPQQPQAYPQQQQAYPQQQPYPSQAAPPAGQPTLAAPGSIQSQPLPPPGGNALATPPAQPGGLRPPPAGPAQAAAPAAGQQRPLPPQPGDEVVTELPSQKIANPTAVFTGLDKITGRTITFDVAINETVQFGALQVTPRVCYTRPPTETPNTDSFMEVDEITLQGEVRRIFTGWMFAASPGLHAVEHPIYDVWLIDCRNGAPSLAGAKPSAATASAAASATPATPPPAAPASGPAAAPPLRR